MSDQQNPPMDEQLVPVTLADLTSMTSARPNTVVLEGKKPVDLVGTLVKEGLIVEHVQARDLADYVLEFREITPMRSNFKGPNSPEVVFFCRVCLPDDGEREVTTVIGGQVIIEKFRAYFAAGHRQKFTGRLLYHEGAGQFSGYYDLEVVDQK